jgi:hypothetical protein
MSPRVAATGAGCANPERFLQVVAALQQAGFEPLVMGGHAIRYYGVSFLKRVFGGEPASMLIHLVHRFSFISYAKRLRVCSQLT